MTTELVKAAADRLVARQRGQLRKHAINLDNNALLHGLLGAGIGASLSGVRSSDSEEEAARRRGNLIPNMATGAIAGVGSSLALDALGDYMSQHRRSRLDDRLSPLLREKIRSFSLRKHAEGGGMLGGVEQLLSRFKDQSQSALSAINSSPTARNALIGAGVGGAAGALGSFRRPREDRTTFHDMLRGALGGAAVGGGGTAAVNMLDRLAPESMGRGREAFTNLIDSAKGMIPRGGSSGSSGGSGSPISTEGSADVVPPTENPLSPGPTSAKPKPDLSGYSTDELRRINSWMENPDAARAEIGLERPEITWNNASSPAELASWAVDHHLGTAGAAGLSAAELGTRARNAYLTGKPGQRWWNPFNDDGDYLGSRNLLGRRLRMSDLADRAKETLGEKSKVLSFFDNHRADNATTRRFIENARRLNNHPGFNENLAARYINPTTKEDINAAKKFWAQNGLRKTYRRYRTAIDTIAGSSNHKLYDELSPSKVNEIARAGRSKYRFGKGLFKGRLGSPLTAIGLPLATYTLESYGGGPLRSWAGSNRPLSPDELQKLLDMSGRN